SPAPVSGIPNAVAVSAGTLHTCALLANGGVWCWGDNSRGQLGDGTTTTHLTPVQIFAANIVAITAGNLHTCALRVNGIVFCWGANESGQLGNGNTMDQLAPTLLLGSKPVGVVVAIAAGAGHSCALFGDGTVQCWGLTFGLVPRSMNGLTNAVAVAAGDFHTCAVRADGGVSCWGDNGFGQLGL